MPSLNEGKMHVWNRQRDGVKKMRRNQSIDVIQAYEQLRKRGKRVVVYNFQDWCISCTILIIIFSVVNRVFRILIPPGTLFDRSLIRHSKHRKETTVQLIYSPRPSAIQATLLVINFRALSLPFAPPVSTEALIVLVS